jgi:hypothetical protein
MPRAAVSREITPVATRLPRALVAARAKVDAWAYAMAYVILQRQLRDRWHAS